MFKFHDGNMFNLYLQSSRKLCGLRHRRGKTGDFQRIRQIKILLFH